MAAKTSSTDELLKDLPKEGYIKLRHELAELKRENTRLRNLNMCLQEQLLERLPAGGKP